MFEKQFEYYQVEKLIAWAQQHNRPGHRFQFKSPNSNNSERLFEALCARAVCDLDTDDDVTLHRISLQSSSIVPVLHKANGMDEGFTENYISKLRDDIASQEGVFAGCSLLIIHNSYLDTIINSAFDLGHSGSVWSVEAMRSSLQEILSRQGHDNSVRNVQQCLLDYQFDAIQAEGATMFGFEPLYEATIGEKLNFNQLGLFCDPLILDMEDNKEKIRKRLEDNRELYKKVSFAIEHFNDQLQEKLPQFSRPFIDRLRRKDTDWKKVAYQEFLTDQEENKKQLVEFVRIVHDAVFYAERPDKISKPGQRKRNILFVPQPFDDCWTFSINFRGEKIRKNEVSIKGDKFLNDHCELSIKSSSLPGGKECTLQFRLHRSEQLSFFVVNIKREKNSECFSFKFLLSPVQFRFFESIQNVFTLDWRKKIIRLVTDDLSLRVSDKGQGGLKLEENQASVPIDDYLEIDYEKLWHEAEDVYFTLVTDRGFLNCSVVGGSVDNVLRLPVALNILDKEDMFSDQCNATVVNDGKRFCAHNNEYKLDPTCDRLVNFEKDMLTRGILCSFLHHDVTIDDLYNIAPEIAQSYSDLFKYYTEKNSLPSLVTWGKDYSRIVKQLVKAVKAYLSRIEQGSVLSDHEKIVVKLGMINDGGNVFLTPIHPLVLAYYLELFAKIKIDSTQSFKKLPDVTLERLGPNGLLPFFSDGGSQYYTTAAIPQNRFWIQASPERQSRLDFVRKLVCDKLAEFLKAYSVLFNSGDAPLLINAIGLDEGKNLFWGIVRYLYKAKLECPPIHITFYDRSLRVNYFDKFKDLNGFAEVEAFFIEEKCPNKNLYSQVVDFMRKKVTFSKFEGVEKAEFVYGHLSFFKHHAKPVVESTPIAKDLSTVGVGGLLCGEASEAKGDAYFTGFGLRGVDYKQNDCLHLAYLYGLMIRPMMAPHTKYTNSSAIALAVEGGFSKSLSKSCDASIWTILIDPKVTLDFFQSKQDLTLIHYTDQYTSSANYDAITVTKKIDIFDKVLKNGLGGSVREFNAFNGTWLLEMLTAKKNIKKERVGVVAAYKMCLGFLAGSSITWVPLSIGEMIRVSGNIGLAMSESDFAKSQHGGNKGAISDDILFVGIKENKMYLLPVEVKTGRSINHNKAINQAKSLLKYLNDKLLGADTLAHSIFRSLFAKQLFIQIENYKLHKIFEEGYFDEVMSCREKLLSGEYPVVKFAEYVEGLVVANTDSVTCLGPKFDVVDNILKIELPTSLLSKFIQAPINSISHRNELRNLVNIPDKYLPATEESTELHSYYTSNVEEDNLAAYVQTSVYPTNNEASSTSHPEGKEEGKGTHEGCIYDHKLPDEFNDDCLTVQFGVDSFTSQPVSWEPTNTAKILNPNTGIIGTMGTGKTQFTKSLIAQLVQNQHKNVDGKPIGMLIFDYKSDYVDSDFTTMTAAKVLKPVNLPYNPLSLFGEIAVLPALTAESFADTLARAYNLGVKQRTLLRNLVLEAYRSCGIQSEDPETWRNPAPTAKDVFDLYVEAEHPQDSLFAALSGLDTFNIFESDRRQVKPLFDLLDGVVVIDLAGYPSSIQSVLVALTLDLFYAQMQKQGKPKVASDYRQLTKMILVDEADNFMSQNFEGLRKILKEGREYGVGTILSTQDIAHFKTSENEYANYMDTWVVHRVANIERAQMKIVFNVSNKREQEDLLSTIGMLEKHQSIVVQGNKRIQKMTDKPFWKLHSEWKS